MQNIVVLGAGFAGLRCALKLERHLKRSKLQDEWSVVLVDKNSYHTYTPALYEAASAYFWTGAGRGERQHFEEMLGGALCLPINHIVQGRNIVFVRQEIMDIDFINNMVRTKTGGNVPYAYLVLALGSQSIYFDVKGAKTCCYGLKTLYDALRIRRRIEEIFRNFRGQELRVTVVGGGATGVETIAEIAKYSRRLVRDFNIDYSKIKITLLEAEDKILAGIAESQRVAIERRLADLGVVMRTGARIIEVENNCVILNQGEKCLSDITLWTAGIKGPAIFDQLSGMELDKRGRIVVDDFLRVKNSRNVFAIGDNAFFTDDKRRIAPPSAFIAEQQADCASLNIVNFLRKKPLVRYTISIPGYVLSCGGKFAVVRMFGITFSGFLGWVFKRLIDFRYFHSILPFFRAYSLWLQELRIFTKND